MLLEMQKGETVEVWDDWSFREHRHISLYFTDDTIIISSWRASIQLP